MRTGAYTRLHRGVFMTTGGSPTFDQQCLAACLAAGDPAFVSHTAVAKLRGLIGDREIPVEITSDRRVRLPDVTVHRSLRVERSMLGPIPVASPARMLADLAAKLDVATLERIADEVFRRHLTTPPEVAKYLRDAPPTWPAIGSLRRIVDDRWENGVPETELESMTLKLIERYRLPDPVRQFATRVNGRNVRFDLAYPPQRVAIEPDGRAAHWGRDRWQSDHRRQNATELGGWRVLHFTYWDVDEEPDYVAYQIATALGLRPTRWAQVTNLASG